MTDAVTVDRGQEMVENSTRSQTMVSPLSQFVDDNVHYFGVIPNGIFNTFLVRYNTFFVSNFILAGYTNSRLNMEMGLLVKSVSDKVKFCSSKLIA